MELELVKVAFTLLVACYVFVFMLLRRVNGFYYDLILIGNKQRLLLPPGDMGWPLIGNFLSFARDFMSGVPDSFINNLVTKYGREGIYKTHLFWRPTIIVTTPETCRKVLTDEDRFKMSYPKSTNDLVLQGTKKFMNAEEHRILRHLTLAPIQGLNSLSVFMNSVEEIVSSSLERMAKMEHPVELLTEASKVSSDVVFQVLLGNGYDSVIKKLQQVFDVFHKGVFSLGINLPGFAFHKAIKARKKVVEILQVVVNSRRETIKKNEEMRKKDLIESILEAEDANGRKMEDGDIIDLIIAIVFGGQTTTASAIMWTIIYLLENPKVMQKAKEEQEEIMKRRTRPQKQIDIQEIKQMVYLRKIINEMLRRNLSFAIFREATVDTKINGYFIPKGWRVISWIRAVHMDPENHPNPEDFNPSRWDDSCAKAGAFLAFGAGNRFCPGSELAKLEITIFLHYFLLAYKFERVNPGCPVTYFPLGMPTDKCLVKVSKV